MARADLGTSIVLIIFGAIVTYESWRMPRFESIGGSAYSAPGLVPGLLGAVIALLGAIMLFRYLTHRGSTTAALAAPADEASTTADPAGESAPSNRRVLVTLVLSVVFAGGLVGRLPFWLAVFLFVFVSILYHERAALKNPRAAGTRVAIAGVIAGATAYAVPFVFERIFLVNLP